MNRGKRAPRGVVAAVIVVFAVLPGRRAASAQHVTAARAMAMMGSGSPGAAGCEDRARQAATTLEGLNAKLERARESHNEADMRAAVHALQKGFADVKGRLEPCRASAGPPPAPAAPAVAASPSPAAAGEMAGMDHSTMNMGQGAAAAPTTVRQISGPAEAALQAFEDALQVGNRDVALQWLAPEATVTEAGATDGSREAYANAHMGLDMAFLKTAKVVLTDRQVQPAGDSTRIVSTSRMTGRAGEMPVDVTVTEGAVLRRTPQGWRIVNLQWTLEPVKTDTR